MRMIQNQGGGLINYRYMYDDENQLEIHQFAMMVNHTVGYEEAPHWHPRHCHSVRGPLRAARASTSRRK